MAKGLVQILLAALAVVLLVVGGAWVFRMGPFAPSPAAKVQAQATKDVGKAQGAQDTQTTVAAGKTEKGIEATQRQNAAGASAIRDAEVRYVKVPGRPVAADIPDDAFYSRLCGSRFYVGNPGCVGHVERLEDQSAAAGSKVVRAR